MFPPENLKIRRVMIAPAALGPTPLWAVFLLLDRGEVSHCEYVGILPGLEGETANALLTRAEQKARDLEG